MPGYHYSLMSLEDSSLSHCVALLLVWLTGILKTDEIDSHLELNEMAQYLHYVL